MHVQTNVLPNTKGSAQYQQARTAFVPRRELEQRYAAQYDKYRHTSQSGALPIVKVQIINREHTLHGLNLAISKLRHDLNPELLCDLLHRAQHISAQSYFEGLQQ